MDQVVRQNEMFIYGCVKRALNLRFEQKYIRVGASHYTLQGKPLSLQEWIKDCKKWNGR